MTPLARYFTPAREVCSLFPSYTLKFSLSSLIFCFVPFFIFELYLPCISLFFLLFIFNLLRFLYFLMFLFSSSFHFCTPFLHPLLILEGASLSSFLSPPFFHSSLFSFTPFSSHASLFSSCSFPSSSSFPFTVTSLLVPPELYSSQPVPFHHLTSIFSMTAH